jgi:hypothetical protein
MFPSNSSGYSQSTFPVIVQPFKGLTVQQQKSKFQWFQLVPILVYIASGQLAAEKIAAL